MKNALNRLEHIARRPMAQARLQRLIVRNDAKRVRGEHLTPAESLELGLGCYDAGGFSVEEALCYVHVALGLEAEERCQAVYSREFHDRFQAIRAKHGLSEDQDWPHGEGPDEYEALNREFEGACDEAECQVLREYADRTRHPLVAEAAALLARDRAEFERRREVGRQSLFGPIKE